MTIIRKNIYSIPFIEILLLRNPNNIPQRGGIIINLVVIELNIQGPL